MPLTQRKKKQLATQGHALATSDNHYLIEFTSPMFSASSCFLLQHQIWMEWQQDTQTEPQWTTQKLETHTLPAASVNHKGK